MAEYHFVSSWQIQAPIERVWEEIYHAERWDVRTTRWWMRLLALVARPAFSWNHGQLISRGSPGGPGIGTGGAAWTWFWTRSAGSAPW